MTDLRKLGPLGQGGESQPVTVDLTRIDIRRGTLYLPRRFYGALPEGEVQASDTVAGRDISVRFQPPRQLEGLGPFYEEHDLRPNDAVALLLTDVLQLTAVRRERRKTRADAPAGAAHGSAHEAAHEAAYETAHRSSHETAQGAAHEAAQGAAPERKEQATPPASSPTLPPLPEIKVGWQDVLHDPAPRRHPAGTSGPTTVPGGVDEDRKEVREAPGRGPEARAHLERLRPEARVQQAERARRESGQGATEKPQDSYAEPHARPLAPEADPPKRQHGLFDGRAAAQVEIERAGGQSQPRAAPRPEPSAEKDEPIEPEREPVAVGAPAQEDAAGRISSYLREPGTPAIVRAAAVAEELRLPLETVQRGLAEVSRASEGAVAPIRPDVYLVKRSG
ncbi:MAG: hypothetical protein WD314_04280 [Trueperaceae bacterium]